LLIPTPSRTGRQVPGRRFHNGSGTTNFPTIFQSPFYGRTYESQYLCGSGSRCGRPKPASWVFVAANPFGQVNWTVNAFAPCAPGHQSDATLTVIYTPAAWNDPMKERASRYCID